MVAHDGKARWFALLGLFTDENCEALKKCDLKFMLIELLDFYPGNSKGHIHSHYILAILSVLFEPLI